MKKKAETKEEKTLVEIIEEIKNIARKRKFLQAWDLIINLKGLDLKKPENRFSYNFLLPNGRGKETKFAILADTLETEAKKHTDLVIKKQEIEKLGKDKKKFKKIVNQYDWFFAEANLMPLIGKFLGIVLGPRGKMPKPIPPKAEIEPFIKNIKDMVKISLKEIPVIYVSVGTENMDNEKISKNIEMVYKSIIEKLPKGKNNVKSVYLKLTMSKPVKLSMN